MFEWSENSHIIAAETYSLIIENLITFDNVFYSAGQRAF